MTVNLRTFLQDQGERSVSLMLCVVLCPAHYSVTLHHSGRSDMRCGRSDMRCGRSDTRCGRSDTRCGRSDTRCGKSDTRCGRSDMRCGRSDTRCGRNDTRCGRSDTRCGRSDTRCGRSDTRCGRSDMRCGKSDTRCGRSDTRCGRSDARRMRCRIDVRCCIDLCTLSYLSRGEQLRKLVIDLQEPQFSPNPVEWEKSLTAHLNSEQLMAVEKVHIYVHVVLC